MQIFVEINRDEIRRCISKYYYSNPNNPNVMYQKNSHNNRRIKEPYFPTPQTRIQERNSAYEQQQICLQHSGPLQLICLNCQNKLLCSQCIQSSQHISHQIRNIERAKQMIYSQYQQWMIRLSSKSQILDIVHIQFETKKSDMSLFSKQYKQKLINEFKDMINFLEDKLSELIQSVDGFIKQYIFEANNYMQNIRGKRKQIEKMLNRYDKQKIESIYLTQLASYSHEIRGKINELLNQDDIAFYKGKLGEPQWKINYDILRQIKNNINTINIGFKDSKIMEDQRLKKKKTKKDIKLTNEILDRQKSQKKLKNSASINPFNHNTLTPKNKSKDKKGKSKKSPEVQILKKRKKSSAKMISMPASPAKDAQSTYLITPDLSRKKLFKKK